MIKATVIVREPGSLKPDFSLDFEFPELPKPGDYISVHRPDHRAPFGEDMIVRQVWWFLEHPETHGVTTGTPRVGSVGKVEIECEAAVGPYASEQWRKSMERYAQAHAVPHLNVARVTVPEEMFDE